MQDNDNTLVDNGTEPIITPADNTPQTEAVEMATPTARPFGAQKPVQYAALAGAGIGIGALTMGFKADGAEPIVPDADPAAGANHLAQTNPPTILEHADLATTVKDDMNFGQAFHAARIEQGAGGVFEWKGQYFNTFYKEEWASMSLEQKGQYAHSIDHLAPPANFHPLPAAVAEQPHTDAHHVPVVEHHTHVHHDTTTEQHTHNNVTVNAGDSSHVDAHVNIANGTHQDSTVSIQAGSHATVNADVNIGAEEPVLSTEPAKETADTALPTEPAHDVVATALPTEPAHDVVATSLPTEPAIHMPDMPTTDLVEIDLGDGVTGQVHIGADGQPDGIFIDQDHNGITEAYISPDPTNPTQAHYMLDGNQDHIVDEQGIMGDNTQLTDTTQHTETPVEYDHNMDDSSLAADFDNHTDTTDWG